MYNVPMNKLTLGYVRVSTEEQATCGHSLENQQTRIQAYATALDLHSDEVIADAGCSAKSLERPGMRNLLGRVRRGEVKTVVVYKLDRLTRSVVDLGHLVELFKKHDVALISVSESLDTSSASGRMFINLLGVLSQWERETISERTTTTLGHLRAAGKVYGPTPYGFRREGDMLVEDAEQQQRLAIIRRLHEEGRSYLGIAADLNLAMYPSPRGGKWHASSVHSVLNNKKEEAA